MRIVMVRVTPGKKEEVIPHTDIVGRRLSGNIQK